jgi:cell division protease FtsH
MSSDSQRFKKIAFWTIAGFLGFSLLTMFNKNAEPVAEGTPYSEIIKAAKENRLHEMKTVGNEMTGKYKGVDGNEIRFKSTLPEEGDSAALKEIRDSGVTITAQPSEGAPWYMSALYWSAMLLPAAFLFMMFRQIGAGMGGGKGGIGGFTKSPAKQADDKKAKKITFADVAGIDEAKAEVMEVIDYLRNPKKYTALGAQMPKGTLLVGPPGTGKTLLAKAVAGEANVPFLSVSGSDFVEMFAGVGASRARSLFEDARKKAPCILFIDEIDAIGKSRGGGGSGFGGHDEREQTLNQILVELDGFDNSEGVILMAATNRPEMLDAALLRPGRFDRQVTVGNPNIKGREEILKVHARKIPLAKDIELDKIARGTPGFSGAELANLVNEAALTAARRNKTAVDIHDFEAAKDKVIMGPENKSLAMSPEEKQRTAWHEAGHALVALKVPGNDPVHKVSIVPRGRALGVTWTLPTEDKLSITGDQLKARLAMMYGGRAAEAKIYGEGGVSTGAGNDIKRATDAARKMVASWGLSKLGPINFAGNPQQTFFGTANDQSPKLMEMIETERDAILMGQTIRPRQHWMRITIS